MTQQMLDVLIPEETLKADIVLSHAEAGKAHAAYDVKLPLASASGEAVTQSGREHAYRVFKYWLDRRDNAVALLDYNDENLAWLTSIGVNRNIRGRL